MTILQRAIALAFILLPSCVLAQVSVSVNPTNIDRRTVSDTGINHDYAVFQSDLKNYIGTNGNFLQKTDSSHYITPYYLMHANISYKGRPTFLNGINMGGGNIDLNGNSIISTATNSLAQIKFTYPGPVTESIYIDAGTIAAKSANGNLIYLNSGWNGNPTIQYETSTFNSALRFDQVTANQVWQMPNASGTLALSTDITNLGSNLLQKADSANYITPYYLTHANIAFKGSGLLQKADSASYITPYYLTHANIAYKGLPAFSNGIIMGDKNINLNGRGNIDLNGNSIISTATVGNSQIRLNTPGPQSQSTYIDASTILAGSNGNAVYLYSGGTGNPTIQYETSTSNSALKFDQVTANRIWQMPNASGTLALSTDVQNSASNSLQKADSAQYVTPYYLTHANISYKGVPTFLNGITMGGGSIDLNGNNIISNSTTSKSQIRLNVPGGESTYMDSGTILAKTPNGNGLYLNSHATENPTIQYQTSTTNSALKFDDVTASQTWRMPNASGTLALSTDIANLDSKYVPYSGATNDIQLGNHYYYTNWAFLAGDNGGANSANFNQNGVLFNDEETSLQAFYGRNSFTIYEPTSKQKVQVSPNTSMTAKAVLVLPATSGTLALTTDINNWGSNLLQKADSAHYITPYYLTHANIALSTDINNLASKSVPYSGANNDIQLGNHYYYTNWAFLAGDNGGANSANFNQNGVLFNDEETSLQAFYGRNSFTIFEPTSKQKVQVNPNTSMTAKAVLVLPATSGTLPVIVQAPYTSSSPGAADQIAYDTNYFYWYAGGKWNRVAKDSTF